MSGIKQKYNPVSGKFDYIPNSAITGTLTQDVLDALQGTSGSPSNINRYVSNSDPRLTGSRIMGQVATFATLPLFNTVPNQYWVVLTSTGTTLLFTYKSKGIYYSDGTQWIFISPNTVDSFRDDLFLIYDDANNNTQVTFNLDTITAGQQRVFRFPNVDGTFSLLGAGTNGNVAFRGTNGVEFSNNLHWDNVNGRLGINNSNPAYPLSVRSVSSYNASTDYSALGGVDIISRLVGGVAPRLIMEALDGAAGITFRRTNTSYDTPTGVLNGDFLGAVSAAGYKLTTYSGPVAGVFMLASENWTDTNLGSIIRINTVDRGGSITRTVATFGLNSAITSSSGSRTVTQDFGVYTGGANNVLRGGEAHFESYRLGENFGISNYRTVIDSNAVNKIRFGVGLSAGEMEFSSNGYVLVSNTSEISTSGTANGALRIVGGTNIQKNLIVNSGLTGSVASGAYHLVVEGNSNTDDQLALFRRTNGNWGSMYIGGTSQGYVIGRTNSTSTTRYPYISLFLNAGGSYQDKHLELGTGANRTAPTARSGATNADVAMTIFDNSNATHLAKSTLRIRKLTGTNTQTGNLFEIDQFLSSVHTKFLEVNAAGELFYKVNVTLVAVNSTIALGSARIVEQTASGITTTLWASPTIGQLITVVNRSGGSNTIAGNGVNIEGSASVNILNGESFDMYFNGTEWRKK